MFKRCFGYQVVPHYFHTCSFFISRTPLPGSRLSKQMKEILVQRVPHTLNSFGINEWDWQGAASHQGPILDTWAMKMYHFLSTRRTWYPPSFIPYKKCIEGRRWFFLRDRVILFD